MTLRSTRSHPPTLRGFQLISVSLREGLILSAGAGPECLLLCVSVCVCLCECVYLNVCVCVCVCAQA